MESGQASTSSIGVQENGKLLPCSFMSTVFVKNATFNFVAVALNKYGSFRISLGRYTASWPFQRYIYFGNWTTESGQASAFSIGVQGNWKLLPCSFKSTVFVKCNF